MGALRSALEVAAPIRPLIRIEMVDAEGPPVGFSRTWLVNGVIRRSKRVGRYNVADQFQFSAMTPLYQHELGLYGVEEWEGDALLKRWVKTRWTHRRPALSCIMSDKWGKIRLPGDAPKFHGKKEFRTLELYMILINSGTCISPNE